MASLEDVSNFKKHNIVEVFAVAVSVRSAFSIKEMRPTALRHFPSDNAKEKEYGDEEVTIVEFDENAFTAVAVIAQGFQIFEDAYPFRTVNNEHKSRLKSSICTHRSDTIIDPVEITLREPVPDNDEDIT